MAITTLDGRRVGTEAYRVYIWIDDGTYMNVSDSRDFPTVRAAEAWGLKRVRALHVGSGKYDYDARIEHIRWVDDVYDDSEYGTVHDGTVEHDQAYNSYTFGVTWEDDHTPGGPDWSEA